MTKWRKSTRTGTNEQSNCVEVASIWRKSKYSGGDEHSECIEVATFSSMIAIRDSKDPDGPRLYLAPAEWTRLLNTLKVDSSR